MKLIEWGLVDYQQALDQQLDLLNKVHTGEKKETLIYCSHPPVVTLGRGATEKDLSGWSGHTYEISRGGKATYHGPNQLVVYPILDLNKTDRKKLPAKDLHAYLRGFEQAIVDTLKTYDIEATTTPTEEVSAVDEKPQWTGVWVKDKKIASIGIAVKKWITYHGAAINLEKDPNAFQGINPCGFSSNVMTSLEELLGEKPHTNTFKARLLKQLCSQFN
ncbi:MAG: lipoyl(octanoyl) transferase LipB [Bdellovibrionales bacterium]|nr:lipoyl(octanoyl) transferase LipB [Bdellovibrionales bacterium]